MRFFLGFALLFVCLGCATSLAPEPHEGVAKRWGLFLSMAHQRAFALAGEPNGQWVGATVSGYRTPLDAERAALAECDKRRGAHGISSPCRLYAVGHRIVWSEEISTNQEASTLLATNVAPDTPPIGNEWERAGRGVRRLAPTSFPSLPSAIARDLERRGCTVPQTYMSPDPHNIAKGSFRERGQTDWAVLCSRDLRSALLIYWGGSAEKVETVEQFSPDAGWLQHIGDGKLGFSRWINATTRERILEYHAVHGGPEPPPSIDHDGLNLAFTEKASTILYWHNGTLLRLQGAD